MADLVTSTYVSRVGRLGNSLMQIATAVTYGKDYNKRPVFTKWDYQDYIKLDLIWEGMIEWNRVAEHGLSYRQLDPVAGNVDLQGHFLSENYFKHQRAAVLDVIKLNPTHEKYISKKYGKILIGNTCSIHVRRSDYLQEDQLRTHGVLPIDYYHWAKLKLFPSFPNTDFIVCSDDMEWCKENFKDSSYAGKHFFIEDEPDIVDLFLMSKCKNHIIANSTFSWWAAWISGNKTIAPKNFFVDGASWPGLYKENWIII